MTRTRAVVWPVWCVIGLGACGAQGSEANPIVAGGAGGVVPPPSAAGAGIGAGAGAGPATGMSAGAAAPRGGVGAAGMIAGTGTASAGTNAATAGAGGVTHAAGAGGQGGLAAGSGGSAGAATAGQAGLAGASGAAGSTSADATTFAKELDGLFIDAACDSATRAPLAQMATCLHPANTQRIEKKTTFGGDAAQTYEVVLRVRGIWEPTKIQGGEHPDAKQPFTIGGMIPPGSNSSDAINYQQYSISVSAPKQTYWLNDHQYVAHDIHKVDYQATIRVSGGASVTVTMNDGNEREIANWTKDYFADLPPYDKMPSLGQTLHLDVVSVTVE